MVYLYDVFVWQGSRFAKIKSTNYFSKVSQSASVKIKSCEKYQLYGSSILIIIVIKFHTLHSVSFFYEILNGEGDKFVIIAVIERYFHPCIKGGRSTYMHETYDNKLEARQWFTMYVTVIFIGASLSEPHIDRTSGLARGPGNEAIYMVRPSSARRVRPHADQEVDRKSPTCLHHCQSRASCCIVSELLYLSTLVVCSMSSTNHQRASATDQRRTSAPRTPESETDKSDSFNEGGSERGTAMTQRQRYKGRNG